MKGMLIKTNCEVVEMDIDSGEFSKIEEMLDCDTLDITMSTKDCPVSVMIYVDDNGIAKELPVNYVASLCAGFGRQIHGDVVVFGLTKDWDGYNSADLSDATKDTIRTFVNVAKETLDEGL